MQKSIELLSDDGLFDDVVQPNEDLATMQKRVLGILERLVSERSRPKIKLVVELLSKHGYFATKTNRGLLVNIRELSQECLGEICNEFRY